MCDGNAMSKIKGREKGREANSKGLADASSSSSPSLLASQASQSPQTPARGGNKSVSGETGPKSKQGSGSSNSKVLSVVAERAKAAKKRLAKMQREAQEAVQAQELLVGELERMCGLVGAAVEEERSAVVQERDVKGKREGKVAPKKESKGNGKDAKEEGDTAGAKGKTPSIASTGNHTGTSTANTTAIKEFSHLKQLVDQLQAENMALKRENDVLNASLSAAKEQLNDRNGAVGQGASRDPTKTGPHGFTAVTADTNVTTMAVTEAVKRVVQLLYCACLFDPFVPYQVEKAAMLAWMHRTQDVSSHMELPRFAEMLDSIGVLGKMITRRPLGEGKSHEESVRYCQDVALRYVLGGDDCVLGWSGFMTKAQVEVALGQVMMSEYFKNEGLMYGGSVEAQMEGTTMQPIEAGRAAVPMQAAMEHPVHRQVIQHPVQPDLHAGDKDRANVATPSPVEDQLGMPAENDSVDSRSEREEIEVDMEVEVLAAEAAEVVHVPAGQASGGATLAEPQADPGPKRKTSGGKKKYKNGGGKQRGDVEASQVVPRQPRAAAARSPHN